MQKRQLGNSDLHLTTIGFGAWAIGGGGWAFGWGPQDDAQSVQAIHAALDRGVNWIDTAAVYGLGHSEEVVARALADRKGKVLVATKCGLCWDEQGEIYHSLEAESIRREVEASLRRLQVDVIDLYQIHWPLPPRQIEEGFATLANLVEEGKIRYAGVSNFSVPQLKRVGQIAPVTSLQPPYSMVQRLAERALLPYCGDQRIGVVVYSPMEAGLLSGAFDAERLENLAEDDWRRDAPSFQEPVFSRTLELVRRLTPLARRSGHTMAQLAIAWTLRRPEVTSAIVGGRNAAQVEETVAAGDWQLSAEELAEVDAIMAEVDVPLPKTLR